MRTSNVSNAALVYRPELSLETDMIVKPSYELLLRLVCALYKLSGVEYGTA